MKILVAPDSFKGTLAASHVARVLSEGLTATLPQAEIDIQPLSDGGEGFVDACCAERCIRVSLPVPGPTGREVTATYGCRGEEAIIEMASAAGIELLATAEYVPMEASTYGVGQLIRHAVTSGIKRIYVGLGGSATHDAGFGLLRGLGARFLGKSGEITKFRHVEKISIINLNELVEVIKNVEVICAADVTNPLLGEQGAAHVYASQKGATPEEVRWLERLTDVFSQKVEAFLGKSVRQRPGAGAAGGTAFAMMACLNAQMVSGFDVVAGLTDLEVRMQDSQVVVTGEGYLDRQSSFGKAPVRILRMAHAHHIPVAGIFGGTGESGEPFDRIYSLTDIAGSRAEAMARPEVFLREAAGDLARWLAAGMDFKNHS